VKTLRAIAFAILLFRAGIPTAHAQTIQADGGAITPQMANDVAAILRGQYGTSTIDESAFNLQGSNYVSLEGLVGTGPNADFGNSQRMVVRSLFAFGASM